MTAHRQSGAALIAALLVAAIAAASAAGLLYAQSLWLTESNAGSDAVQARIAARAGIAWAAALLHQDARTSSVDHGAELWATPLPPTDIEGSAVSGRLQDLQGRYNINNLVRDGIAQPREIARYKRLLEALGLPASLAETAADWMDADHRVQGPDSAEDGYYLAQPERRRTSGRPLTDLHELLQVKGYSTAVFTALAPYLAALPAPSAINVNTAPPEVLMLIGDRISLADARQLMASREKSWFRDAADFALRLAPSARTFDAADIRTTSDYFHLDAHVRRGRAMVDAQAIIHRTTPWPRVVWQRIDG